MKTKVNPLLQTGKRADGVFLELDTPTLAFIDNDVFLKSAEAVNDFQIMDATHYAVYAKRLGVVRDLTLEDIKLNSPTVLSTFTGEKMIFSSELQFVADLVELGLKPPLEKLSHFRDIYTSRLECNNFADVLNLSNLKN